MSNEQLLEKIYLVVEKLMNLGGSDYEKDKTVDKATCQKGMVQRDFGIEEWDWPQGIGLYGLKKLQDFYGDDRYLSFFQNWYHTNVTVGLPSKNINTTAPFLPLIDLANKLEQPELLETMCREHANWLCTSLPKTKEGGFQHVTSAVGNRDGVNLNDGQIWVDTLIMAVLFLNKAGIHFNVPLWKQEAAHQFLLHIKYLYDKQTGLFHHGWSFQRNDNFGGIFWCRGNSWFTFGVMDYILACGDELDEGCKAFLIDTYKAQAASLIELQSASGLWHTVLTDDSSYEEVSGSAAIAAGLLKGVKAGILNETYHVAATKAIDAICQNIDDEGTVLNVSAGTAIGMNADHYKNILITPMAYGQALTLAALCEALV